MWQRYEVWQHHVAPGGGVVAAMRSMWDNSVVDTAATWITLRSVLARRWRSTVLLALLLGFAGGSAAAMFTMASDIESAFPTLLREVDAPDLVAVAACEECPGAAELEALFEADPAVARVEVITDQSVDLATEDGRHLGPDPETQCATGADETSLVSSTWDRAGHPPMRVIEGRAPAPGSANEIALPSITARRSGVNVGDTVILTALCLGEDPDSLHVPLEVVGIAIGPFDFRPPGTQVHFETVFVDPALTSAAGITNPTLLFTWLEDGVTADALRPELAPYLLLDVEDHRATVESSLSPDATALRLLGLLTVVAAVAVLGQLLVRHELTVVASQVPLLGVGARRRDLWKVGALSGCIVAVGALVVSIVIALVVRSVLPRGSADALLDGKGPSGASLAFGALVTLAAVALLAGAGSFAGTRRVGRVRAASARPFGARLAEGLRLRPSAALGVRFALEPGSAAGTVPVRTGLGAIAIALAAVVAAVTFGSNLDRLRTDTSLVGWNWDIAAYTTDAVETAQRYAHDPDVAAATLGTFVNPGLTFEDNALRPAPALFSFETGPGTVRPSVLRGRAPAGPDELLLAPGNAPRLGVDLGDTVPVYIQVGLGEHMEVARLELVGIGVLPVAGGWLDVGASMTLDGLQDIVEALGQPTDPHAVFFDLEPGADVAAFAERLAQDLHDDPDALMVAGAPVRDSEELVALDLSDAGWVPAVFGIIMGLTMIAVLTHLAATGVAARRKDLAIARALGFANGSVRSTVAWQSVTLVIGALVVAVPLGVITGLFAWTTYAEGLEVVPDASAPWARIAAIAVLALIVALAVSIWPGARILRRRPIEALRAE